MNKLSTGLTLPLIIIMAAAGLSQIPTATAGPVLSEPEYIVEDQNGLVLGGLSRIAFKGQILVAMSNSTNHERYWVQVFTTSGSATPVSNLIGEQLDVWYSEPGCSGVAYIKDPANAGVEAALRGATYAIGRKGGVVHEDSIVLRGSGTGSNNSALMSSKFKALSLPFCTENQSTTAPTVVATQVADLSNFVRPFKYR